MADDGTPGVAVREPADLSAPWLTAVLQQASVIPRGARISDFNTVAIGSGRMSESHRVHLRYADACDGPETLVLKVAASDPAGRATGVGLGAYAREVRFYRNIAAGLGGPVPACHHADGERHTGWFTLVLEDLFPARQGDVLAGATLAQAGAAIDALAQIQAAAWEDPQLADMSWLNTGSPLNEGLLAELLPGFAERYGDRIAPEHLELRRALRRAARRVVERPPRRVGAPARRLPPRQPPVRRRARPAAGGGRRLAGRLLRTRAVRPRLLPRLQPADRGSPPRTARRSCAATTMGSSRPASEHCSLAECFDQYRRMAFGGLVMSIAASMLVQRTARGDDVFMAVFSRHAQHAIDLELARAAPTRAGHGPGPVAPRAGRRGPPRPR